MRILINIQGGIVQAVCTDLPKPLEVMVIDYDGESVNVPQSENPSDTAKADIFTMEAEEIDKHLIPFFDSVIKS